MKLLIDIPDKLKTEVYNHGLFLCPNDKISLVNAIIHGVPQETVTEFADRCRECGKMRTGHWIVKKDCEGKTRKCICDKCGYETGKYTWKNPNYCAECGVRMIGERNEQ